MSAKSKSRASSRKSPSKSRIASDFNLEESSTQEEELVRFGVDMSKLSDYLDHIIRAVNQHAKLLDDVSKELAKRPHKTETGELFALLSHGFPYEEALAQLGLPNHVPRAPKVSELLGRHNVAGFVGLTDQQAAPVRNMWEGLERFLKVVEVTGRICIDSKQFQSAAETQLAAVEEKLESKLSKAEYAEKHAAFQQALTSKLDARFDELERTLKNLHSQFEQDTQRTRHRIDETEQNTLWKIKDFSDLLAQRPTIQYVDEQFKGAISQSKVSARTYTDQEIDKLKHNEGNPFKIIERLRSETEAQFKALNALIL